MSSSCKILSRCNQWICCTSSVTSVNVKISPLLKSTVWMVVLRWHFPCGQVVSTVGYSWAAFTVAPRLLARNTVRYHRKVLDAFGCYSWVTCTAVALCLAFLLHAQISSYLHLAPAFPGTWFIHWVFAYISVWTGTLFSPVSLRSEWFSSVPGAIVYSYSSDWFTVSSTNSKALQPAPDLFTSKLV